MYRLIIFYIFLLAQCNRATNDKEAFFSKSGDTCLVKLTGKRKYNVHDPGNIIKGETYRDSLVLEIPCTEESVIKGEDIPVPPGYYKYKGTLIIKNRQLNVSLFYDNYDDKKLEPLSWNGNYILK
jgi:hypothetical protein